MVELHETYIAFQQAARQQTVRRIGARLARVRTVQVEGALRLLRQVQQIGHRVEECFVEEVKRPEHLLGHGRLGQAELAGIPEQLDLVL